MWTFSFVQLQKIGSSAHCGLKANATELTGALRNESHSFEASLEQQEHTGMAVTYQTDTVDKHFSGPDTTTLKYT